MKCIHSFICICVLVALVTSLVLVLLHYVNKGAVIKSVL